MWDWYPRAWALAKGQEVTWLVIRVLAIAAILVLQVPLLAATTSETPVTLRIEPYFSIAMQSGISMEVRATDFYVDPGGHGNGVKVYGSSGVTVDCNANADIWCPMSMDIENTSLGGYEMECDLSLTGPNPITSQQIGSEWWWVLPVSRGHYNGGTGNHIVLEVSRKQVWTVADLAGVYTGTVWMYIVPQGSSTPY